MTVRDGSTALGFEGSTARSEAEMVETMLSRSVSLRDPEVSALEDQVGHLGRRLAALTELVGALMKQVDGLRLGPRDAIGPRLADVVSVTREEVARLALVVRRMLPGPSALVWVCDTYCSSSGRLLRRLQVAGEVEARLWLERSGSAAGSLPGAAVSHCAHQVNAHWSVAWDDAIGGDECRASQL